MKKNILSLIVAAVLWQAGTASAAITPQITFSQATNAVLSWPSTPGDSFMVLHRAAFHPSTPWKILATNLPAGPFNLTTFTHVGAYRILPGMVLTGGSGGGGSSPPGSPAAATLAAPTTDPSTTTDKAKKKDEGPPTLPDEKELEKQYREWLKEWEKQQKEKGNSGGGVQTLSATYTLPDASYTNFTGGFYVITRAVDDTDGDGIPDWWEAQHGLNLLVDDASADADGDGVSNLAEYGYGTDPQNPNSKPTLSVTFTSPVNTGVWQPTVQITGYANANLTLVSYDVVNSSGAISNETGFVTGRVTDFGTSLTSTMVNQTNYFQCYDAPLAAGANNIRLRFMADYGLSVTQDISFTYTASASPAPPVGTVLWPANGTKIGSDFFTLRGRVDNTTATVKAFVFNEGDTNVFTAQVERDGTFWLDDLPAMTNAMLIVTTDASGKSSTNSVAAPRGGVDIAVNPPDANALWSGRVALSGTVSDPTYGVWVNSVSATVDVSGNWSAENVPVNAGGTASFSVRAIPGSDNGGAGAGGGAMAASGTGGSYSAPTGNPASAAAVDVTVDFEKPPRIYIVNHVSNVRDDNPTPENGWTNRSTMTWQRSGSGYSGIATAFWRKEYPGPFEYSYYSSQTTYPFPGTNGVEIGDYVYQGTLTHFTNFHGEPSPAWQYANVSSSTAERIVVQKISTKLMFETGGRSSDEDSVHQFALAGNFVDPVTGAGGAVAPENIKLFGTAGSTQGTVIKLKVPKNTPVDVTPQLNQLLATNAATATNAVTVYVQPEKVVPKVEVTLPNNFTRDENGLVVVKGDAVVFRLDTGNLNSVGLSVTWEQQQMNSTFTFGGWQALGPGAIDLTYTNVTATGGVFQVRAKLTTADGQKLTVYFRRKYDERLPFGQLYYYGNGRKTIHPEAYGVVDSPAQITLMSEAKAYYSSAAYLKQGVVAAALGFPEYGAGSLKCNIFVAHRAASAGFAVPKNNVTFTSAYPPIANQWAGIEDAKMSPTDATYIPKWRLVPAGAPPQPGWIIAAPNAGGAGHCGITDYDGYGIGAGSNSGRVNKVYPWDGNSRMRRYDENY